MSAPIWLLVEDCARTLHVSRQGAFAHSDLIACIQRANRNLDLAALNAAIRQMIANAPGRPSSRGRALLHPVSPGFYVLNGLEPDRSFESEEGLALSLAHRTRESIAERVDKVRLGFDRFLELCDRHTPFDRTLQLRTHLRTIQIRRDLGGVAAAIRDQGFLLSLRATLEAWGLNKRGSRLVSPQTFQMALFRHEPEISALESENIERLDNPPATMKKLWSLVDGLEITSNQAKIVAATKTLHHLLPDLVVPIDRTWTGEFFGWPPQYFQDRQQIIFTKANMAFMEIAEAVKPSRCVGSGWRSSPTKVIDNALIGYCLADRSGRS